MSANNTSTTIDARLVHTLSHEDPMALFTAMRLLFDATALGAHSQQLRDTGAVGAPTRRASVQLKLRFFAEQPACWEGYVKEVLGGRSDAKKPRAAAQLAPSPVNASKPLAALAPATVANRAQLADPAPSLSTRPPTARLFEQVS